MADSEVRQKFEAWQQTLMMRSDVPTLLQAFEAGMRAGEIAQREEIADLEEQLRDAYAAIERKNL